MKFVQVFSNSYLKCSQEYNAFAVLLIKMYPPVIGSRWAAVTASVNNILIRLSLRSDLVCIAAFNFSSAAAAAAAGPVERVKLSGVLCVWLTAE